MADIFSIALWLGNVLPKYQRCLRFDNALQRRQNHSPDKLPPIRDVFEQWVSTLHDAYEPHENITADEQLVTFSGRCLFRQYIPSKPRKYGIKVWAACDSTNYYVTNLQVYTGKDEDEPTESNQGKRVVLDLTQNLSLSGRNITTDNFFTSLDLAKELERKQMTLLGTIRKNRRELPAEFVIAK